MAGSGMPPRAAASGVKSVPALGATPPPSTDEDCGDAGAATPDGSALVPRDGDRRSGVPAAWRSIRIRIVLPVLLASAAVVGLGLVQTRGALDEAAAADRAQVLARLSSTAVALVHHTEQEYSETAALRQRGGVAGAQLLTAARARTDAARARYDQASSEAREAAPALTPVLRTATRTLDRLSTARTTSQDSAEASTEFFDAYDQISERLIAVADAVPAQLTHRELIEIARPVMLVAELEHLAAKQLDLLRRVFDRQRLEPGELVTLAGWAGGERQRRDELQRLAGSARERFVGLVAGRDVIRAEDLRDAVLDSDGGPRALEADPDVWVVAQSGLLRRLRLLQAELTAQMVAEAQRIRDAARERTLTTAVLTLVVVAGTLAGAIVLAVRTSRRLRRMRGSALSVASAELPDAISRVTAATDATAVQEALQESSERVDAAMAAGSDEIGELGAALGAMHRQALRLAADQALLRMEVEAIFIALSRRGQTLAQRQIHQIDEFGRVEHDPQRLMRLYALDHLAARMRRNEENLLVLAGGEPGRRFTEPVPVADAIAAAVEEVEEHGRVEVAGAPPAAIAAYAVGDFIHLLAELLENALTFSPPTTKVRVAARRTVESLHLTVFDEGIGMPADKVEEANRRLSQPSALTSRLVGTMGLLVVARLAGRHGMRVRLTSTPGGGTAATVNVPEELLALPSVNDPLRWGRWHFADSPVVQRAGGPAGAVWPPHTPAALETSGPVPTAHGGYTASGLPRRVAPSVPAKPDAARVTPPAKRASQAGPPDPDTARARLSSLASGIAAAQRRTPPLSPPPT
jgi:signal transduction histidine kinase